MAVRQFYNELALYSLCIKPILELFKDTRLSEENKTKLRKRFAKEFAEICVDLGKIENAVADRYLQDREKTEAADIEKRNKTIAKRKEARREFGLKNQLRETETETPRTPPQSPFRATKQVPVAVTTIETAPASSSIPLPVTTIAPELVSVSTGGISKTRRWSEQVGECLKELKADQLRRIVEKAGVVATRADGKALPATKEDNKAAIRNYVTSEETMNEVRGWAGEVLVS